MRTSENSNVLPGEVCALVQEVLLSALTLTGANSSKFQSGKINFAAFFCCFCKNTSVSLAGLCIRRNVTS